MLEELSPSQLTAMLNAAPIGILLLDGEGKVTWMNNSLAESLGPRQQKLLGTSAATVDSDLSDMFKPEGEISFQATADSPAIRWLTMTSNLAEQYRVKYFVDTSSLADLKSERDQLRAQVQALATKDEVTGLLNHNGIYQALEPQVSRSRRYDNLLSVLTLKIANYAALQQQFNTDELNILMLAMSQVLNDQMRWADAIGRVEADEILMVLPETEATTAQLLADKIQTRLSELFVPALADKSFEICTRFGMAQWQKGDDVALLMRRARDMMENGVEAKVAINA